MTLEIERRFLIKNDEWKKFITKKTVIEQGYLSHTLDDWIIRIRFNGSNFKIALKRHIKSFTNFEFEYLIPNSDGEKIMSHIRNTIKKDRFFLKVENQVWIIDCFKEKNYPLEVAEIELPSEDAKFNLPTFISTEITGFQNFSNFNLSTTPFSEWKDNNLNNFKKY